MADAGVLLRCIERLPADTVTGFYAGLLDIESRSWKGQSGEGADQPPMKEFYRYMFERISPAGLLRVIVAELADKAEASRIFEKGRAVEGFSYIGEIAHGAVRDLMSAADVFVSTANHEFFGISAVEAIAAGEPQAKIDILRKKANRMKKRTRRAA